jgi:hypothetical protein
MSIQAFMLVLAVGSALLALWLAIRLPKLGPHSAAGLAAAVVTLVIVLAAGPWAMTVVWVPLGAFAAIFVVALPCCTYLFLLAAWIIVWMGRLLGPNLK